MSFLFSCASETKKQAPASAPRLIDSKAQIKSGSDSNNVKIEIALLPHKIIRLEVTAVLGYRVASLLMTPQKIQYALHTNETYAEGPFNAKTFYPIFKQNLDPKIIWRVIHDQNPQSADLNCSVDQNQKPLSCVGPNGFSVKWMYEDSPYKRIEIKGTNFEMIWLFKEQHLITESQSETFVLKKPEGYKEILLK